MENENQNEAVDFSKLPITNNFMFCHVMMDEDICREFLETMLDIKIDRIEYINSEQQMSASIGSKYVRLDVYVEDGSRVFDIEMQMTDTRNLPLRARYYQSAIDAGHLRKNHNYNKLCESFIIFIMPMDIFGSGFPKYTFEYTCLEKPAIKLGDKTQKIFYNFSEYAKAKNEKVRNILKYFNDGVPSDDFTEKMKSMLEVLRMDEDLRDVFATYKMDIEAQREDIEHDAKLETARKMMSKGLSFEMIAECTGLTSAEITALQAEISDIKY